MPVPQIKTPLPGPKARAIIERDTQVVSPSYTRSYPFVMARGKGAAVEDVDGNVFLDCAAGIAVNSTGHSHPDVVAAIVDQAGKFLHMSGTDFYYEPQVRLGEEMNAIAPWKGPKKSFFANSGTEAIEAAIKLARYHTKRNGIIAFLGSFHGRTMGSLSLTSSRALQRKGFGPPLPGVYHAPYPNPYRRPAGQSADECAAAALSYIEDQILVHLASPDEVAAVVVESIQGEGGYVVPPAGVSPGPARADAQARHPADGGRSAVRDGPHRPHVRDRALRRRARCRGDGEGHRLGTPARRHDGARGRDGLATRLAREHVRRQPRRRAPRRSPPSSC